MSIQSTQYVAREWAINRIKEVYELAEGREYRKIEAMGYEEDWSVIDFVKSKSYKMDLDEEDFANLEKLPNSYLGKLLDQPFYRRSMFENYLVKDEE